MPLWLLFLIGGAVVAAAAAGPRRMKLGPIKKALRPPFEISGEEVQKGEIYVGPPQRLGQAEGWRPIFIQSAQGRLLEWGACYYQWQSDLGSQYAEDNAFASWVVDKMGAVMDYVLDLAGVVGWLVKRICFRVEIPSLFLKIDGEWYVGPQSPRGSGLQKMKTAVGGGYALPGFNPETTRNGFAVRAFPEWPLEWPPPKGTIGAGWMRDLGDITGTGYKTYQLITYQDGSERSFPLMSEAGWRAVFGFSDRSWPGHSNSDPLSMFNQWRMPGVDAVKKKAATKTKAQNRYATRK